MNCEIQEKCGGCAYGKMPYAQQLKTKTEYVEKQLQKLTQKVKVNYCIGMENPYNYRNKGKYAFKMVKWVSSKKELIKLYMPNVQYKMKK